MKKNSMVKIINVGFYDMTDTKGLNLARMKDALHTLPKIITEIVNPSGEIENLEDFCEEISDNDVEGQGVEKIIITSNIFDIYTRLEILLGLKLSGHTKTLTEASNLLDEFHQRGEIQIHHEYRNALDNFHTE